MKYEFYRNDSKYNYLIVINYNKKRIKNKGSAIFIHVAKKNYKKTEGCIAVKKVHLLKIVKNLKRRTMVLIENRK